MGLVFCGKSKKYEECDYLATEEELNCHHTNVRKLKYVLLYFGIVNINDHTEGMNRNLGYAQNYYHLQKSEKKKL